MGTDSYKLKRTFSVIPEFDPLYCAIKENNCDVVKGLIESFPLALDRRYALYAYADNPDMQNILLATIKQLLKGEIEEHPYDGVRSLLFGYAGLANQWSCCSGVIKSAFMQMLSGLKAELLGMRLVEMDEKFKRLVMQLPSLRSPEPLKEYLITLLAQKIYDEKADCKASIGRLPADLHVPVLKAYEELVARMGQPKALSRSQ